MISQIISNLYQTLENRFGTNVAVTIMSILVVFAGVGVIVSFKTDVVLGIIMLSLIVTPVIIGLVTVFTWGHVNLAVVIDNALFHTSVGMTIVTGLILAALAILIYRFPEIVNDWAKGKIFQK